MRVVCHSPNHGKARERLRSIDFWFGFVRLSTLDLYKEASGKRGVDQGYLRCSAEFTNLQVNLTNTQVPVNYRWNVSSVSIDMSADNRTTTLGRHIDQHIGRVSVDIQLFRQRLSHKSVKAYATMPIGIMGRKSLALMLIEVYGVYQQEKRRHK